MASQKTKSALSLGASGAGIGAMAGGPIGAAIGGGLGLLGGYIFGGDEEDQAKAAQDAALAQIMGVQAPELSPYELQAAKMAGTLSPEAQEIIKLQPSELKNISADPRLRQAQLRALVDMQKLGEQGLDLTDIAALKQARQEAAGQARAQEGAVLANLAQRGMLGSGEEIAARIAAGQAAANRSSNEGDRLAAMAQQRRLEAIAKAGRLGGEMEQNQFSQAARQAEAQDIINRWNAQNAQQTAGQNVASRNEAQKYNISALQDYLNKQAAAQNASNEMKNKIKQQNYENSLGIATAKSNAKLGQAQQLHQQAQDNLNTIGSIGQGALGVAGSLYGMNQQDQALALKKKELQAKYPGTEF